MGRDTKKANFSRREPSKGMHKKEPWIEIVTGHPLRSPDYKFVSAFFFFFFFLLSLSLFSPLIPTEFHFISLHTSLIKNHMATLLSTHSLLAKPSPRKMHAKYTYRTCPICSERLLVRMYGSFVYKWINHHFSTRHHEWMHVVVNLRESS
ncbi:hypothetical protein DM01DRAFT_1032270 [Hesseltinella vesiculosa]|uniref:Uncharacterized protein n=1 Tax=Hesseltinella vesiculosa TaxID=101127 RepID=A0A1X2GKR1_9FUNG|nr:hypothetical protein DM01DRAFT_1032270 [Hesseltinella vesiculosa]